MTETIVTSALESIEKTIVTSALESVQKTPGKKSGTRIVGVFFVGDDT